jgi:hypothetical protein
MPYTDHRQDRTTSKFDDARNVMQAFGGDVAQQFLAGRGLTSESMQAEVLDQYYRRQDLHVT